MSAESRHRQRRWSNAEMAQLLAAVWLLAFFLFCILVVVP